MLKALRKEPERRYAWVQEFSEDIDAFFRMFRSARARRARGYRGRKFLKRNRPLITAAAISAVVVLGLVEGLGRIGGSIVRPQSHAIEERFAMGSPEV